MKLEQVTLTKAQLDKIPENERTLLVLGGHAMNELSVLNKLFHFSVNHPYASDPERDAFSAQAMVLGRLLAGKLFECWELVVKSYFGTRLAKDYDAELIPEAKSALEDLKTYFAKGNPIRSIRNRHAFHYAPDQIPAGYSALHEDRPLRIYFGEVNANTLYAFADVIAGHAFVADIDPRGVKEAYDVLISDTSRVLRALMELFSGLMTVVFSRYLGTDLTTLGAITVEITGAPHYMAVTIPYYIEIASSEVVT